jgi:hypothetical protein
MFILNKISHLEPRAPNRVRSPCYQKYLEKEGEEGTEQEGQGQEEGTGQEGQGQEEEGMEQEGQGQEEGMEQEPRGPETGLQAACPPRTPKE